MPFENPLVTLSGAAPNPEATAAVIGTEQAASRGDHMHPRLTSATNGTLNASNEATVTFTRSFSSMPCIDFTYIEAADNPPITFKVKQWTTDGGGNYIGCVCKGYRGQVIPQNLATLLLGAVFNVFAGSASGVQFTCIALQQS
jgi:hypothetical protein